ncbi:MAG: radical SAM protein [Candidatus Aenigmarchaeota archaeon]|nr:radical SAM protein [Candidatus Aenigmarchaeota archaeon]
MENGVIFYTIRNNKPTVAPAYVLIENSLLFLGGAKTGGSDLRKMEKGSVHRYNLDGLKIEVTTPGKIDETKIEFSGFDYSKEITKVKKGTVMLSSVTDPYQPMEQKYQLTRKCLEILQKHDFPVSILTKSPLVTRDIDVLKKFSDSTVGVTITTNDNVVRKKFEPLAPDFEVRIDALKQLSKAGLKTYAFLGPLLPMDAKIVAEAVAPYVKFVYIDRPNYPQLWQKIADENKLDFSKEYFEKTKNELIEIFKKHKVEVKALF